MMFFIIHETYLKFALLWFLYYFPANLERSNLYLKLFKLVFGSVSLFANENEQMLKVQWKWTDVEGTAKVKRCAALFLNFSVLYM